MALIDDAFQALRTNEVIRSGAETVVQTMMGAPEFSDFGEDQTGMAYALGLSAFAVGYRLGFEAAALHIRRMDAEAN